MKTLKQHTLAILVLISAMTAQAQSADISVAITNIKTNDGHIVVSLFDSEKNFLNVSMKAEKLKAKEGKLNVTFKDIPKGTYTVLVIHDENDNGKLDINFMRIPKEPYGISMDGKSMFAAPSYDGAKFDVNANNLDITISL